MTDDDPKPSTYFHQALADPAPGGRWAGRRPHLTGTAPTVTPPAVPEWCIDPTGPEPPLGYSVEHDSVDVEGASTEAEGMAEDLLPSDAMPDASVGDEPTLHDEAVPPTYLGALSSIGRRRDFHIVRSEGDA
jgi:hypothetical protein